MSINKKFTNSVLDVPYHENHQDMTISCDTTHFKLSSLITKDFHHLRNPILNEMHDNIFNDTVMEFYTKLKEYRTIRQSY